MAPLKVFANQRLEVGSFLRNVCEHVVDMRMGAESGEDSECEIGRRQLLAGLGELRRLQIFAMKHFPPAALLLDFPPPQWPWIDLQVHKIYDTCLFVAASAGRNAMIESRHETQPPRLSERAIEFSDDTFLVDAVLIGELLHMPPSRVP